MCVCVSARVCILFVCVFVFVCVLGGRGSHQIIYFLVHLHVQGAQFTAHHQHAVGRADAGYGPRGNKHEWTVAVVLAVRRTTRDPGQP